MKLAVLVVYWIACLFEGNAQKCKIPVSGDVDWERVGGPWYDVLDIPTADTPTGCWLCENVTVINDDLVLSFLDYGKGQREKQHFVVHYVRQNTGVYKMVHWDKAEKALHSGFEHFVHDEKLKDEVESKVDEEIGELLTSDWMFLTDYESYIIMALCHGQKWRAFVKAASPQITVEVLNAISRALVENGLTDSTMVMKNGCLDTGNGEYNDESLVII